MQVNAGTEMGNLLLHDLPNCCRIVLAPSLSALSQEPPTANCCFDATCYYCWEVEACACNSPEPALQNSAILEVLRKIAAVDHPTASVLLMD